MFKEKRVSVFSVQCSGNRPEYLEPVLKPEHGHLFIYRIGSDPAQPGGELLNKNNRSILLKLQLAFGLFRNFVHGFGNIFRKRFRLMFFQNPIHFFHSPLA